MKAQYSENEERLRDLVENQKMQLYKVAEILGVHWSTVNNWCRRFGLKTQRVGPRTGVACKGGRILRKGYDYIFCPNHPHSTKKGYILESHLVMEGKLGRYLEQNEVVHHIDKNTRNNHPDNLKVFCVNAQHLKDELKGKRPKWSEQGFANIQAWNERRRLSPEERSERNRLRCLKYQSRPEIRERNRARCRERYNRLKLLKSGGDPHLQTNGHQT
jgi:hypothetical protein